MDIEVASWESRRADKAAPPRRLSAACAGAMMPENVEWLWPGRFAVGKLGLLVGHPGLGKSQVALAMAAAVSSGGPWPCGEGSAPRGSVVILSTEDAKPDTVIPRLAAAGADASRIYFLADVIDDKAEARRTFNVVTDLDLLELIIEHIGDVRLVILDPISSYLAGAPTTNNAATRCVLDPIAQMAYRQRVAVVAISHFSRNRSRQVLDRVAGAVAFPAAARSVHMVVKDGDGEGGKRLLVELKNNLGPETAALGFRIEPAPLANGVVGSTVRWDDAPVAVSAEEAVAAVAAVAREGERWAKDEAKDFLGAVLADGPVAVQSIACQAHDAGVLERDQSIATSKIFRQARKELGIKPCRIGGFAGSGSWFWALPDALPAER